MTDTGKMVVITFRSLPENEQAVAEFVRREYPRWHMVRTTIGKAMGLGPEAMVGDLFVPVGLAAQANEFWAVARPPRDRTRELLLMRLGVRLIEERRLCPHV